MTPIASTRHHSDLPGPLQVISTGAALGAEVAGVDLRELGAQGAGERLSAAVHGAWLEHRVLLFRGQHLSDPQLIAFSRRFGDLDHAPIQENGRRFVEGYPELYVVSNVVERGVSIGSLGSGEASWHTDMSYLPVPPKASVLYALEVPEAGGDTYFCDMYGAYEALPPALQRSIAALRIKHDGTYNSGGYVREGVTPTDDPRIAPGALHPLVCIHPETGRRCLYLGRRRNAYIEGLPLDSSESLLNELWSRATEERLTWRHRWRVGDLVLWDNRCTMHRRDSFDPATRRLLHRTQIKSEAPPHDDDTAQLRS
jgi:alpha-ketoglutarate-dependent taurine dioxygenase